MANASRFPISVTPRCLRWVLAAAGLPVVLAWMVLALSPARAAGDCSVSPAEAALDGEEQALLDAVNAYRQQNGLGTLTASPGLNRAAAWMSRDMALNNHLLHVDTLGRDTVARMADCGWTGFNKGENLAGGTTSASQTLDLWKNSPVHNQQLLQPVFKVAGVGRYNTGGLLGSYWTLDLGGTTYTDVTPGQTSAPPPTFTPTRVATAAPTPFPAVAATPFPTVVANPLASAASPNGAPATSTGAVRFYVNLVGANGLPAAGDLSGFTFTLTGSGGTYTSSPTDAQGSSLLSVPAGTYSIRQLPKAGVTPLNLALNTGPVTSISVSPGATTAVTATNQIAAAVTTTAPVTTSSAAVAPQGSLTAPVQFSVSLSVMNGVAPQGGLDGYVFTLTAMTGAAYTTPPTDAQGRTQIEVPAGTYALSQQPKPGSTVVGFAVGAMPAATVTVVAGQPQSVTVTNDVTGAVAAAPAQASTTSASYGLASAGAMETVSLVAGCTNVPMTWPAGTPLTMVAAEIAPSGALDAIWRWDSTRNAYLGYSSRPGAPADYATIQQKFEAAFVCMKAAGSMSRPAG
jgi:uncharacterized protein YkwD